MAIIDSFYTCNTKMFIMFNVMLNVNISFGKQLSIVLYIQYGVDHNGRPHGGGGVDQVQ